MALLGTLKYIYHHPLAGRHKVRAFSNFFSWQVKQAIRPVTVIYPFIGESKFWVKKGMTGATGNIYTGLHEFEDMGFLLHFLRETDMFIDIGSNIGIYTILSSSVVGADTISIEPIPGTFEILEKNILLNGIEQKVIALNLGIGSKASVLRFTKEFDTVNHVISAEETIEPGNVLEVPVSTLDEVMFGKEEAVLIKIDVEGFEQEVLNGAVEVLRKKSLKAIIIELNGSGLRYGFDEHKIHQQLLQEGFKSYTYSPFSRTLNPINQFGNLNTIYIRDIDFVNDRIKSAKKFPVFSEEI